jgi:molybdopterin-guanine dinucleotide biosynthesis protein A
MPRPFTAVLLAGGASTRMGRDKALLPLADGRLLWQRQLGLLEALVPAEIFIAGPPRPGFPQSLRTLSDEIPNLGPLSGLHAVLEAMTTSHVLILAIDLPAMTVDFLRHLLQIATTQQGLVPRQEKGWEPFAAIYPRTAGPIVSRQLRGKDRSLQSTVNALVKEELVRPYVLNQEEERLFLNWNEPQANLVDAMPPKLPPGGPKPSP